MGLQFVVGVVSVWVTVSCLCCFSVGLQFPVCDADQPVLSDGHCGFALHEVRTVQDYPHVSVWGYSFLFVTLINLCSLTGILVLPCMKSGLYKIILMFMVALAVGTLVGSGVLVLIPEVSSCFSLFCFGPGFEGSYFGVCCL